MHVAEAKRQGSLNESSLVWFMTYQQIDKLQQTKAKGCAKQPSCLAKNADGVLMQGKALQGESCYCRQTDRRRSLRLGVLGAHAAINTQAVELRCQVVCCC